MTAPAVAAAAITALAASLSACSSPATTAKTLQATTAHSQSPQAAAIAAIVRKGMKTYHLRAVIVRVTKGDKIVTTQAFGPSMTGEPATPAMHFRNGAVALGHILSMIAKKPLATLLRQKVLKPMGLTGTAPATNSDPRRPGAAGLRFPYSVLTGRSR